MSNREYDSRAAAIARHLSGKKAEPEPPSFIAGEATTTISDPTFDIRRKQANLCEAVMQRVVDLEAEAARLTEIANKLRAAVVANT